MIVADRFLGNVLRFIFSTALGGLVTLLSRRFSPGVHADWVDINPLALTIPRLSPQFAGYRLVQISDFHIGTWLDRERLEHAIDLVNRLQPDLVAITGDFVTSNPEKYEPDLVAALQRINARDGAVAVLGNHDHWSDPAVVRRVLRKAGIRDLSNTVFTVTRGSAQLHIAGIDAHQEGLDRLDLVLEKLPASGAAILLAHEPDFADISAATGRFDLQISGHTHGGQIRFGRFRPPVLPRYGRKYPSGLCRVGDMYEYTNRGLGTAELQLRLNCPPEITVFTLQPTEANTTLQ